MSQSYRGQWFGVVELARSDQIDSGDILKVELTVFVDGGNMGHERKPGGRMMPKFLI